MTWTAPVFSVGWIVALVVLIAALMLGFMGILPKEVVLLICAVAAVRL
jgi:hypothetical protein